MLATFLAATVSKLWRALGYSWCGLQAAWRYHWAFRLEVLIGIVAIPLALFFGETAIEKVLLIGSVILVAIVELINSAIETVVNRIGLERHELSGQAKDLGSAAVLISGLFMLFTWIMIIFG